MTIDRSKLAIWIVVISLAAGGLVLRQERKVPDTPQPAPPPVTATVTPPPAPVLPPEPPPVVQPPKVATPLKPVVKPVAKPVAKPAPKAAPAPVARVKTKAIVKRPRKVSCSHVPSQAYEHSEDTVVAFARARGVDEADIVKLKACIAAHAGTR